MEKCIMLKHLSKDTEDAALGSQSPPAKRSCPDLQVKNKTESQTSLFTKLHCDLRVKQHFNLSLVPAHWILTKCHMTFPPNYQDCFASTTFLR